MLGQKHPKKGGKRVKVEQEEPYEHFSILISLNLSKLCGNAAAIILRGPRLTNSVLDYFICEKTKKKTSLKNIHMNYVKCV
jgi:hypothetical protein